MRILGLTSSNTTGGDGRIAEERLMQSLMKPRLEAILSEPVEIFARAAWPSPSLPDATARWMDRYRPELVIFSVNPFAFQYRSVPAKFERKFGTPGRYIAGAGLKMAATPWIAHNRGFQWTRRQIERYVGGASYFEPHEVVTVAQEVVRTVLRTEGVMLAVFGPATINGRWARTAAELEEARERALAVHRPLKAFCEERHVWYRGSDDPELRVTPREELQGDEVHANEAGHRRQSQEYLDLVVEICRLAQRVREGTEEGATA